MPIDKTPASQDAERLAELFSESIRRGVQAQFDEARIQHEDVIEEHTILISIDEDIRESGVLSEVCETLQKRDLTIANLQAQNKRTQEEVVFGFYEEEKPIFAQGYSGSNGCELCYPVTANEVQSYVDKIASMQAEVARLRLALLPFAERAKYFDNKKKACGDDWRDEDWYADDPPSDIYLEQLRSAEQALGKGNNKECQHTNIDKYAQCEMCGKWRAIS